MFASAGATWGTIAGYAATFFYPLSPIVRYALAFAVVLVVVSLGTRFIGFRARGRSGSEARSRNPLGYTGSGGLVGSGKVPMPKLNLREKMPSAEEWRAEHSIQSLGRPKTLSGPQVRAMGIHSGPDDGD